MGGGGKGAMGGGTRRYMGGGGLISYMSYVLPLLSEALELAVFLG